MSFTLRFSASLLFALFSMGMLYADPVSLTINGAEEELNISTCNPLTAFATSGALYTGNWEYEFKLYRNGNHLATRTQYINHNGGPGTPLPAVSFTNLDPISGSYTVTLKVHRVILFIPSVAYTGSSNAVQVNSSVSVGGSYATSRVWGRTVSGDFDNDNRIDDIAGFYHDGGNSSSFHVWTNNGGNSLIYQGDNGFWSANTFNSSKVLGTMASGDFDGDGYHDDAAMLYNYGGGNMEIFVFESNGSSFSPKSYFLTSTFDPSRSIFRVVSGDFDNDGLHDDLAVFYDNGNRSTDIWVFKSNGSAFTVHNYWSGTSFDCNRIAAKVVSGDFDNDGKHDDLATLYDIGNGTTESWVFTSNGSYFSTAQFWYGSSFNADKTGGRVTSGDFDGDGHHDDLAAIYDYGNNTIETWVFRSNGAYFTPISYYANNSYDPLKVSGKVVSGDFDHDGRHDDLMALYDYGNNDASWHNFKCNGSAFEFNGDWWTVCTGFGKTAAQIEGTLEDPSLSPEYQESKIYPNPFSNTLYLNLGSEGEKVIQVYDMQGKMVKKLSTLVPQTQLDMESLPKGIYLVKVASASETRTFRAIKQ